MRPILLSFALGFVLACGGAAAHGHVETPAPMPPTRKPEPHTHHAEHTHAAGHEPLVHRFERAEEWVAELEDPDRDARQKPKDVVQAMEIAAGMTVADIGAGTGYFEPHLSRAVGPTGRVLALDIEPDMVRYLGERSHQEQLTNVQPLLAQADDPGLAAHSVDRILIVDTWHHIAERTAYAQKLGAALKPGGRIYIVDYTHDAAHGPPVEHRIRAEQVAAELTQAGLRAQILGLSLPEQYIVVATSHADALQGK